LLSSLDLGTPPHTQTYFSSRRKRVSAPGNFNGRHQKILIDPRALNYVDRERDRDRQQRFHWREHSLVHFETGQFMERSRSPLRYPPRDFSPPQVRPFTNVLHNQITVGPDYGRYEEDGFRNERERDFRYSREDYGSHWNYFEAKPQYQNDYGRDNERPQLAEYISQILLKYYIPTIEMLVK
jgi:hypothetical protein